MEKIGFSGFLTKPIKKGQLYDCIRTAISYWENPLTKNEQPFITTYSINEAKESQIIVSEKQNILLVEDNKMNQKVAMSMLKKLGHTITLAKNGLEAVKAFNEECFDLILMDGQMPEMDGLEAATEIRKIESRSNLHRVPIIAVTANAMKGDRELFLESGMDDYITKPVKRQILEDVISKYS